MEISLNVLIVLSIFAILGISGMLYFFFKIILPRIMHRYKNLQSKKKETKEKLKTLNEKFGLLMEEKLELSIKLKRLEDRIITNAKNRVKKKQL